MHSIWHLGGDYRAFPFWSGDVRVSGTIIHALFEGVAAVHRQRETSWKPRRALLTCHALYLYVGFDEVDPVSRGRSSISRVVTRQN